VIERGGCRPERRDGQERFRLGRAPGARRTASDQMVRRLRDREGGRL